MLDTVGGLILVGILAAVLILYYLSEREKRAVRRKLRRRFRPQWTRRPEDKGPEDGSSEEGRSESTRRRKRP